MSQSKSPIAASFGSWKSAITSALIVGENTPLDQLAVLDGDIYWTENRPREQGRYVLVRQRADGAIQDVSPAPFNVRSLVHEYGGGAFLVAREGIFFSNFSDQRLYRCVGDAEPEALTAATGMRYADVVVDARRGRLIAVREDHSCDGEAANTLVAIDLASGAEQVLVCGHDFFSTPCISPDGAHLAWLSWDHPNMPWDGCELWQASINADGSLTAMQKLAGGDGESVFQPSWSPTGELHFVSDRSGWWNLYCLRDGGSVALLPRAAEFALPQWLFGMHTYGFDKRGRIVCSYAQNGDWYLALLNGSSGHCEEIGAPFRTIRDVSVGENFVVFIGGSATAPEAVVRLDLDSREIQIVRSASSVAVAADFVSTAEAICFPTEGGQRAHAFYYPPKNPRYVGPGDDKPPLIVISHGGPTAASNAAFKWNVQYWTSRGFAIVDVNYGGSSGYGRAYRQRLNGQWGVVDVDDAVNAARYLIARGDVNPDQVAIRGGSAGGYTTLCALTFRKFFKAGASHYGIGDLEALARDTHKFESRYLDSLIGSYPAQQALYHARSPINFTERLSSAMILFQGAEDKAVPPSQAEAMFQAVRDKGLPVAYLLFANEQHGFRRAENIKRALEAELYFYGRIFGFTPAETIEPLVIENLPAV